MERNNKTARIIEFNGLPGSGKTTISKKLGEELKSNQEGVMFAYCRYGFYRNMYSAFLSPRYYTILWKVIKYLHLYSRRELIRAIRLVYFVRMYDDFLKDKSDFLIVDQGIIQSLISIAYPDCLIESPLLKEILTLTTMNEMPILIVNCLCDVSLSGSRIEKRTPNGARVGELKKDEMQDSLRIQESGFALIKKIMQEACPHLRSIDISTANDISYNVTLIENALYAS